MAHVYRGGRILVRSSTRVTAMVVENGRIAWLGDEEQVEQLTVHVDAVIELEGALVTPGFVDAHVHATSTGLTLRGVDLSAVESAADILDAVARAAASHPGTLVVGHGWDESRWGQRELPTAQELSRAASNASVYLTRVDAHSALVSSALMTAVPEARGVRGFSETGWVTQEAHHLMREHALGSLSPIDMAHAQDAFLARALECGIVGVHEMAGPVISSTRDCMSLMARSGAGPSPLITLYWGELAHDGGMETARSVGAHGIGGDLFVDGSLGSHTACMLQPYDDAPSTSGREFIDRTSLDAHLKLCVENGMQTGFHAIGDAATEAVMKAYSRAGSRYGRHLIAAQRHRIEHAESMSASAIDECGRLGIIASMQPVFDARWGGESGMYADRLGPDRARRLNPIGDLHRQGVSVAFGSDAPVTPLDPWGAVHAAVHHHSIEQRITYAVAISAHTRAGWHAAGVNDSGELSIGARAHLAIWDVSETDGFPPAGATALRTVIDGECAFDSGRLQDLP